eukprot:356133-Chlamydomonas_euryale.AAC.26
MSCGSFKFGRRVEEGSGGGRNHPGDGAAASENPWDRDLCECDHDMSCVQAGQKCCMAKVLQGKSVVGSASRCGAVALMTGPSIRSSLDHPPEFEGAATHPLSL